MRYTYLIILRNLKNNLMRYYDCVPQNDVDRFLEPLQSVRINEVKNRYYTWSGLWDWKQLCSYVHRALTVWQQLCKIVQRAWTCHGWQLVWISTLFLSRRLHLLMQDSRVKRGRTLDRKTQQARLLTDSCQTSHCVNSPSSRTNTAW